MPLLRTGLDVGGTKIEGVVLSESGAPLTRQRVSTPRSYDATLRAITSLVGALETTAGATTSVGVGIPGAVSPETGLVKNANATWLNGRPFKADLEACLERPVRMMNDANCFVISEASDGAAQGAAVVFGVILGTGVGGGIVVHGRALVGPNLIAGEWGHNPLPWMTDDERPGRACYCGKAGCIETFLSGPAFEYEYMSRTGVALSSHDIVAAVERHDARAIQAITRYVDRLARGLASVINVLDPDVIVLGGGMSNVPSLAESVARVLPTYVFSDSVKTRVVRNAHGDSSGVRGAAWLWPLVTSALHHP